MEVWYRLGGSQNQTQDLWTPKLGFVLEQHFTIHAQSVASILINTLLHSLLARLTDVIGHQSVTPYQGVTDRQGGRLGES